MAMAENSSEEEAPTVTQLSGDKVTETVEKLPLAQSDSGVGEDTKSPDTVYNCQLQVGDYRAGLREGKVGQGAWEEVLGTVQFFAHL